MVVPSMSASSSSRFHSSTYMTLSRQENDHPKSSSSSSTSPPMTSSTVSGESVDRQELRNFFGIDHHPAIVSSERVGRQERGDPYSSEISEELLVKPTKIQKPKQCGSRASVERPVSFRHTGMAARIQRESCG